MALDLEHLSAQIEGMGSDLQSLSRQRSEQIAGALTIMREQARQLERLKARLTSSKGKTTWLAAGIEQGLDGAYKAQSCPADYTAIGADGSQIALDRHNPVQCFLINVGTCLLHYGEHPRAELDSRSNLCYREEDLYLASPEDSSSRHRLEGPAFAAKREIDAFRRLVDLVKSGEIETPCVALLDASLILWSLAGQNIPDFVRFRLLDQEFLPCLDQLQKVCAEREIAVASYVSSPRATEVVNALRMGICPFAAVNCNVNCPATAGKRCGQVDTVQDRDLFSQVLAEEGSRSDVFVSRSSIVQKHYREHEVCFFYVNAGSEIARVEVPRWVAADVARLDLVHSLVLDQVSRGHGYPVALTEAHERAVVTATDRESFWRLVEGEMGRRQLHWSVSEKSHSKSIRGI